MATTKPRITITMDPRVYEVVNRLASANGRSMSAVVTDFLDLVQPQMERMVVLLEAARRAPEEAAAGIKTSLAKAERALRPALLESLRQTELQLDAAGLDWQDIEPGTARRRAAGTPGGGAVRRPGQAVARKRSPPVPVTRGVGTPKKPARKAQKGRSRA